MMHLLLSRSAVASAPAGPTPSKSNPAFAPVGTCGRASPGRPPPSPALSGSPGKPRPHAPETDVQARLLAHIAVSAIPTDALHRRARRSLRPALATDRLSRGRRATTILHRAAEEHRNDRVW